MGHPDVERTGEEFLQIVDAASAGLGFVYGTHSEGHCLAGLCEAHIVVVADEELRAEFLFQLLYLLREGALRYVQAFRRIRKIKRFGSFGVVF